MRIIIIDDDRDLCQLTQKVLISYGYMVLAFYNAQAGIKAARENPPDLILMDIMMPGKSGPEIVEFLQSDPDLRDIPVVFLSSLAGSSDSLEGITVRSVSYQILGKPYEIEDLLRMIKKFE